MDRWATPLESTAREERRCPVVPPPAWPTLRTDAQYARRPLRPPHSTERSLPARPRYENLRLLERQANRVLHNPPEVLNRVCSPQHDAGRTVRMVGMRPSGVGWSPSECAWYSAAIGWRMAGGTPQCVRHGSEVC